MDKVTRVQKSKLKIKFLEFERKGLESYAKYLDKEFKNSADKAIKKAYHNYIAKEVENTAAKIKKINDKLA